MTTTFPMNFFTKIFSVKKIFTSRNKFSWFQLVFIFIFINSLFLVPLSKSFLEHEELLIPEELSEALESIDRETADSMKNLSINNQSLNSATQSYDIVDGKQNLWEIFYFTNHWEIRSGNEQGSQIIQNSYGADFSAQINKVGVIDGLKTNLLQNNLPSFFLTTILNTAIVLTTMNLVLIIGVSMFLYFTKTTSSIKTFKESLTISLLSVSLGTIIATIIGLFVPNIILMYGIESISLIVASLYLFYKTRFVE